jgi:hypothetical protein
MGPPRAAVDDVRRRLISPLCGGESIFPHLRAGLSPSKCLENARGGH